MKKLIAVAALASLAACGGGGDDPSEADDIDAAAADVLPSNTAGTYTSTTDEGEETVTVLGDDGTYSISVAGEELESGTWEDNIRGTCLMAEGGDGEQCFNIQPGEEEGMKDITDPAGETSSWSFEA